MKLFTTHLNQIVSKPAVTGESIVGCSVGIVLILFSTRFSVSRGMQYQQTDEGIFLISNA